MFASVLTRLLPWCLATATWLSALAPPVPAQCFDWQERHGPGLTGWVRSSLEYNGDLYVGGDYERADGLLSWRVAKWDGMRWHPLVRGVGRQPAQLVPDRVTAMAAFDDGSGTALYVAGEFYEVSGLPIYNVARWDGSSWSPLGAFDSGPDDLVEALAVHDDGSGPALYAAGHFKRIGSANTVGIAVDHIARWDGVAWQPVGGGMDGPARDLFVSGGALYAGGEFTSAGGVAGTEGVARWNGAQWEALGSGLTASFYFGTGGVLSFEEFDDGGGPRIYAGGLFQDPSGGQHTLARWDGAQWQLLRQDTRPVEALHIFDDGAGPLLYLGTSQNGTTADPLITWDGTSFTSVPLVPAGENGSVFTISSYDDGAGGRALHVGGLFANAVNGSSFVQANHVARWNGTDWSALGSSAPDLGGGETEDYQLFDDGSGEAMYVAGAFTAAGSLSLNHVARWDGSAWSALGTGTDGKLFTLQVHDDGSGPALYAGGKFATAGGVTASNVASWDGQQWSALGSGTPARVLKLVSHDDGSGTALYAGGGALPVTRWDGVSWTPVGTNPPFARSMTVHDDGGGPALYVGFGNYLANSTGDVWKWDGQNWTSIGPANSRVGSLYSYDDGSGRALYAGGGFDTIGGTSATFLARWDGAAWSALANHPFLTRVKSMTTYDDGSGPRLAAGAIRIVGLWDGAGWTELPQLFHAVPSIVDLEAWGRELFIADENYGKTRVWGPSCECPPLVYCGGGKPSATCSPAPLTTNGVPSLSLDTTFDLRAGTLGGTQGLFFFGRSGAQLLPWGAGTSKLCVRGPLQRLPVQNTGGAAGTCVGALTIDFSQWMRANPIKAPQAGDGVWLQGWYLDAGAPKNSHLTGAVEFYVCP